MVRKLSYKKTHNYTNKIYLKIALIEICIYYWDIFYIYCYNIKIINIFPKFLNYTLNSYANLALSLLNNNTNEDLSMSKYITSQQQMPVNKPDNSMMEDALISVR